MGCATRHRASGSKSYLEMLKQSRSQGFGPEVKRRIMLGTFVLSSGYYEAYYAKASQARRLICGDYDEAFESCDLIAHPVAPTAAFPIGESVDDPLAMYLGDIYSVVANLVGIPAISIPCGRTESGLPVGVQLSGPRLGEGIVLEAALGLETLLARAGTWRRGESS